YASIDFGQTPTSRGVEEYNITPLLLPLVPGFHRHCEVSTKPLYSFVVSSFALGLPLQCILPCSTVQTYSILAFGSSRTKFQPVRSLPLNSSISSETTIPGSRSVTITARRCSIGLSLRSKECHNLLESRRRACLAAILWQADHGQQPNIAIFEVETVMTQAEEKFELVLTMPAYRNWIGPDTAEMHVYVRGGDDRLLRA